MFYSKESPSWHQKRASFLRPSCGDHSGEPRRRYAHDIELRLPLPRSIRLAPTTLPFTIIIVVIRQIGVIPDRVDPIASRCPFRHGDPQHLDNLLVRVGGLWSQVIEHAEVVLVFDAVRRGKAVRRLGSRFRRRVKAGRSRRRATRQTEGTRMR